jgi:hypothetical protein
MMLHVCDSKVELSPFSGKPSRNQVRPTPTAGRLAVVRGHLEQARMAFAGAGRLRVRPLRPSPHLHVQHGKFQEIPVVMRLGFTPGTVMASQMKAAADGGTRS